MIRLIQFEYRCRVCDAPFQGFRLPDDANGVALARSPAGCLAFVFPDDCTVWGEVKDRLARLADAAVREPTKRFFDAMNTTFDPDTHGEPFKLWAEPLCPACADNTPIVLGPTDPPVFRMMEPIATTHFRWFELNDRERDSEIVASLLE